MLVQVVKTVLLVVQVLTHEAKGAEGKSVMYRVSPSTGDSNGGINEQEILQISSIMLDA